MRVKKVKSVGEAVRQIKAEVAWRQSLEPVLEARLVGILSACPESVLVRLVSEKIKFVTVLASQKLRVRFGYTEQQIDSLLA